MTLEIRDFTPTQVAQIQGFDCPRELKEKIWSAHNFFRENVHKLHYCKSSTTCRFTRFDCHGVYLNHIALYQATRESKDFDLFEKFGLNEDISFINQYFPFVERLSNTPLSILELLCIEDIVKAVSPLTIKQSSLWFALVDDHAFLASSFMDIPAHCDAWWFIAIRVDFLRKAQFDFTQAPPTAEMTLGRFLSLSGQELHDAAVKLPSSPCFYLTSLDQFNSLNLALLSPKQMEGAVCGATTQDTMQRTELLTPKEIELLFERGPDTLLAKLPPSAYQYCPLSRLSNTRINEILINCRNRLNCVGKIPNTEIANNVGRMVNWIFPVYLSDDQIRALDFSRYNKQQILSIIDNREDPVELRVKKIKLLSAKQIKDCSTQLNKSTLARLEEIRSKN